MYSPISSVGGDWAPMMQQLLGVSQGEAASTRAGVGLEPSAGVQTLSKTLQTDMQGLLQSAGGANQNDKVLQTLMALLLLVVMLANSGKNDSTTNDALTSLAQGLSGGSARSSTLSSEWSFYYESTTVTYAGQSPTLDAVSTGAAPSSSQGSQIDIAA